MLTTPNVDLAGVDDEHVRKFYVDDEPVWVVAEGVYRLDPATNRLRLIEYRTFVADVVRQMYPSPTDLRRRWATTHRSPGGDRRARGTRHRRSTK